MTQEIVQNLFRLVKIWWSCHLKKTANLLSTTDKLLDHMTSFL